MISTFHGAAEPEHASMSIFYIAFDPKHTVQNLSHCRIFIDTFITFTHPFVKHLTQNTHTKTFFWSQAFLLFATNLTSAKFETKTLLRKNLQFTSFITIFSDNFIP